MRPGIPLTSNISPMSVHLHENTSKSRSDPRMGVLTPARISVLILALTDHREGCRKVLEGTVGDARRSPSIPMPPRLLSANISIAQVEDQLLRRTGRCSGVRHYAHPLSRSTAHHRSCTNSTVMCKRYTSHLTSQVLRRWTARSFPRSTDERHEKVLMCTAIKTRFCCTAPLMHDGQHVSG